MLGINSRGKVSPFIPGCQVVFTQIGQDGKPTVQNKTFTTFDGLSGISTVPIQPHTISKQSRTCEDCHSNRKTLGLGTGIHDPKANGVDLPSSSSGSSTRTGSSCRRPGATGRGRSTRKSSNGSSG